MARVSARNIRGVKVHGTGHGRTPVASGNLRAITPDRSEGRKKGWAKKARSEKALRQPKVTKRPGDPPAPHKTWRDFKRNDPKGYRQAKKVAWRRWRKRKRAKARSSS